MAELDTELLDAARYLSGSWKSTHRATGDLCARAAVEIRHLRAKLYHIGGHPDTPELIKQYAKGMLDGDNKRRLK